MKPYKPLSIYLFTFFSLFHLTEVYSCTVPDAAGTINGKNTTCYGDKVTYSVATIGFATSYKWTIPSNIQIISGANTNTITLAFANGGGTIRVQGINTCDTGVSSSYTIKMNGLPKITLTTSQKFCCDYGSISLGSSSFASPTGGTWYCRQNSNLIVSNTFITSMACDPKKGSVYSLYYSYQDPSTTCINTDSTYFTINPLPALITKKGSFCQSKMVVPLQPQIVAPTNLNIMAAVNWKLLKSLPKKGGGYNNINDLVYDADPSLNSDYRLKVDTGTIDLGNITKDSLILEVTIQDYNGCFNKDTMVVYVLKNPVISFKAFPELCINSGKVNLTKISNATPNNGCWFVASKTGYSDSNNLKPGLSCDTLNLQLLSIQKGPGLYWMRYNQNSGGCVATKEMELRINPLPTVRISISQNSFCEIDDDVTLNASPSGGTWTSSVSGVIIGSVFKPKNVSSMDRDKWILLTYSYANPNTKCDTAKSIKVFVQTAPRIKILTQDIDTCRKDTMEIKLTADFSFTSKISWVHSADPSKAGFENQQQLSNKNPTVFKIRPQSRVINNILITAFTEAEGVCPFAQDDITLKIDSTPCKNPSSQIQNNTINLSFEVTVFPNPNNGKFTVEVKKAGRYSLKLYTITGDFIMDKPLEGFQPESIDHKLSGGTYFLWIKDGNGYYYRKIIMIE